MENTNKLHIIKDYEKLDRDLQEQIKLVYPEGYSQHLISFKKSKGSYVSVLRFETFDKIYLIRMTVRTAEIMIEEDIDYNEDGVLKQHIMEKYKDKYADIEYLSENENYDEEY